MATNSNNSLLWAFTMKLGKSYASIGIAMMLSLPNIVIANQQDPSSWRNTADPGWITARQDRVHNITSYTRTENNSNVRSFRVESVINSPISSLIKIYKDVDNLKKWFWGTREATLLKSASDNEFYYHTVFQAPLIPDRDAVMQVKIQPDPDNPALLVMQLKSVSDYPLQVRDGLVRVKDIDITVRLAAEGRNRTRVAVIGSFDPGGTVPEWVLNHIQIRAPYSTMLGLQRMAALKSTFR